MHHRCNCIVSLGRHMPIADFGALPVTGYRLWPITPITYANEIGRLWQTNQPTELITMPRFLGDKLGTALPLHDQFRYNAGEGLHRL